jgi:Family of unknown function (DUF5694)
MKFIRRLALVVCFLAARNAASQAPVQVMIVGTFHMANPGHDLHNVHADDVLAPKRQTELAAMAAALDRFRPTKVAVEWPKSRVDERYPQYLAGTLPPSRNEVVQLGFRLAKLARAQGVYGIDADGDFPYEPVQTYATAHGDTGILSAQNARLDVATADVQSILDHQGIAPALRYINGSRGPSRDNSFYRAMLLIGQSDSQPGADLLTAWYHRNFLICSNLLQLAKPGDRIVVFYGYGHAFLLRQCVTETTGYQLVEANQYLPH